MRKVITTAGILLAALLPLLAAVSPEAAPAKRSPAAVQVAIAQPLAAIDRPLVMPVPAGSTAVLPEAGLIMLVGSALLALGTLVRRTKH